MRLKSSQGARGVSETVPSPYLKYGRSEAQSRSFAPFWNVWAQATWAGARGGGASTGVANLLTAYFAVFL